MLQLRLLGQFDVRLDGKRVIISSRAGQSLLAYLALTAGTMHRREKLAGIIWPDTNDENARKNLRQELWRIRKAISTLEPSPNDFLVADEFTLKFNNSADYWLDVAQMERPDKDLQSLIANLSLYQGELLPGFYDDWVGVERERVQVIFDLRMEELLEQLSAAERWIAVQEWGERWLTLSGARESAYRHLMLASGARGEAAKVAALYQRCQDELMEQLGVEPSAETRALYEGLLKSTKSPLRVPAQPSGTITFLFTDIEASTHLLEMLGDQYAVALGEHHEILRAAVKKWNGREIDTQGDAFFVTFTRALDAVQCAAEAQRSLTSHAWQNGEVLRVRMGLHTGEPLIASTGYVGMDVHRAARIGDAGHGGQILLSQTTRELVYQDLPAGLILRELGEHRLKDMKNPTPLYQLVGEGLPDNFPPIRTRFTGTEAPTPGEPPFKGLQFFDEQDANLFFGREALTARLIQHLQNANFLSVIIGASGSGKSSLVRAGLVPALKKRLARSRSSPIGRENSDLTIHIMTPTAHPLEALAIELTRSSESVTAAMALSDDLSRDPRSLHFFLLRQSPLQHTLLVIDQFEELFTLCHDDFEREAFIDNLLAALKPVPLPLGESRSGESRLTLIITLRADFYAHLAQYSELRDAIAQQQEYIGPMTSEELRRAIEEPAHLGRWEFEPGLVDLILRDVGEEPGALPLLSHALLETWKRRAGHMLTLKGYAEAGGVRGAIAYTAESLYQDLSQSEQGIMRKILLRLTEFGDGTEDTRRRASFEELLSQANDPDHVRAVLNRLAEARLVTLGEETAEVAHEALIREWPTLRAWLEDNREGLRLHRHLTEAAQEWLEMNREPDLLYRGARLTQAREWASLHVSELNELENEFLRASIGSIERELAERESQRQRELDMQRQRAEEQSHAARQLRRRAMWLTSALIIAGVLALAAVVFGQRAQEEARLSASRELAAAAISNLDVDPERSILLALQSISTAHTLEAEDALHKAVFASRAQLTIKGHDAVIWRVAFSPDGSQLVSASQDGVAKVWNVSTGEELFALRGHRTGGVNSAVFSPDGKRLATVGDDKTIRVWDAATGQELRTLSGHTDIVIDAVFSPDGKYLASASVDQTAMIWDAEHGRKLLTLRGHMHDVVHVFFSQADNHLMTSSFDGTVKVWDVKTGKELLTLPGFGMAFSPDGTRVATTEDGAMVKISDITTSQQLFTLRGHTNRLTSAAFSRDGKLIATTSLDKKAVLWDASTGRELFTLSGHTETVESAAFSPDTMRLATGDSEGTIKIWDLTPSREVFTIFHPNGNTSWFALNPDGGGLVMIGESVILPEVWKIPQLEPVESADLPRKLLTLDGHQDRVRGLTYSPDGSLIASGSVDGTAKIWDVKTGEELGTFTGHKGEVLWVAFSPDGTRLISAGEDKTIRIWEVKTGKELFALKRHHLGVFIAVFSPDGKRFATGADDGSAKIWDTASGQELFNLTHPGTVFGVAFSPDGKRLATASNTEIVKVWDALSGEELFSFSGHTSSIVSIAFSPDGKRLATASRDGTAKLWDAASGQELLTLNGSGVGICCVAFSPDGKYLFTGGDDGVRVYTLQIEDLVALARSRLTRSLTTEECQKYLRMEECPAQQ